MKALLIDSTNRNVREIEVDGLEGMQKAVGGYIERAGQLPNGDDVFVNEEGMINGTQEFFVLQGLHQPLAGNGLVLSHTRGGNSRPPKSQPKDLHVVFVSREFLEAALS